MNFQIIDLIDKFVSKDSEYDFLVLMKEGVLSTEGQISLNKLNLMTGALVSDLMDSIANVEINAQELTDHIVHLVKQNEYMGCYYFQTPLVLSL